MYYPYVNFILTYENLAEMEVLNWCELFDISNTFISNTRLKWAKNPANAKQHPEADLLLFEN